MTTEEFNKATAIFTSRLTKAAAWKDVYGGAAYSTRLMAAIDDARNACSDMERVLKADRESRRVIPIKEQGQ